MAIIQSIGTPISFEPNPPGVPRPGTLSAAFNGQAFLYTAGTGGPQRMLMQESFGYSILDLTNKANPTALVYDYLVNEGFAIAGDGQSYLPWLAVSPDGQRVAFSFGGPGYQWGTCFGVPNGSGFTLKNNIAWPNTSVVIKQYGARYIAYHLDNNGLYATDITSLSTTPDILSGGGTISYDTINISAAYGGTRLQLVGNYLVYRTAATGAGLANSGGIRVIDISNPGAIGNIGVNFKTTYIPPTLPYYEGKAVGNPVPYYDNTLNKLFLLLPLQADVVTPFGQPKPTDSWGLLSLTQDGIGNFNAVAPVGTIFNIPAEMGLDWTADFSSSLVFPKNGKIAILMAMYRRKPSYSYGFYGLTVDTWGAVTNFVPSVAEAFASVRSVYLDNTSTTIYTYSPTGSAYTTLFTLDTGSGSPPPPPPPPTVGKLLAGPTQFEPNPPGATRPPLMNSPYIGAFYKYKVGNSTRLLVTEPYGYHVDDITNQSAPSCIGYEDFRHSPTEPGPFPLTGDGHNVVSAMAVSEDGQRAVFQTAIDQVHTYRTLVCGPSTNGWGFTPSGDALLQAYSDFLIQKLGPNYYVYAFGSDIRVANITALPGLAPGNVATNAASALPVNANGVGYNAILTGHWITYKAGNTINLVNVATPLPAYNLAAKTLTPADFGRSDTFVTYTSSVDPSNPEIVYILGEFANGVRYTLIKITSGNTVVLGSLDVASGDLSGFANSFGLNKDGSLFAFMWTKKLSGAVYEYKQYLSPVSAFGVASSSFQVSTTDFNIGNSPTIVPGTATGEVYSYVPAGNSGWWFKMSAQYAPAGQTPSAPTSVTASQVNSTTVSLSWNAPANSGSTAISGYSVTPHETLLDVQLPVVSVGPGTTTAIIPGLTTGKEYNFYVFAKNSAGNGAVAISNVVTPTAGPPPRPPSPPAAQVPGVPSALAGVIGNSTIGLSWKSPTADGGSPITGYTIVYRVLGETPATLNVGVVNNAVISSLSPTTNYLVKIAAKNKIGTGPFCQEQSFTTSSYRLSYGLASWPSFNNEAQSFNIEFTVIPTQFNGLTAISRDLTTNTLYSSPHELYPAHEEIGKVTVRTVKRKKSLYTVGASKNYYDPPGNTTVSAELQNLSYNLNICGLGMFMAPQPDAGYVNEMLKYSARPGDIYTWYKKYASYFSGPNIFATDHGSGTRIEWKTNRETPGVVDPNVALMPNWAFEYIHTRPFLRFDTRNLTDGVVITKAFLTFKKDPNCPIVNPEGLSLKFVKLNSTVNDNNLTSADYDNLEGTVLATLPLNNTTLQNGAEVTLDLPDLSFIKKFGFSKMAIITSLENSVLPTSWTQVTLQDVTLTLVIDISTVETPGEISYVITDPADRSVSIEWGAPVVDGGSAVISYTVKNANTGETKQVLAEALKNVYTYNWTGLTNDFTYSFIITANNVKGAGQGTVFSATPTAARLVPGPVRNLFGLPEDESVMVTWDQPTDSGSSPIEYYFVTNAGTGEVLVATPSETMKEFTGLTNGTTYTIIVLAKNAEGIGAESSVSITPTGSLTAPGRPAITDIYAEEGMVRVFWIPPANDGGDPITGWIVTLDAPGIPNYLPINFSVSNPDARNFTINNLNTGNSYIVSVAAVNNTGTGPAAYSDQFTVSSGVVTDGLLVDVDYNYQRFYEAPAELNINSSQYLNYLYPESDLFYAEQRSAYVQSDPNLRYPIHIGPSFRFLYFNVSTPTSDDLYTVDLLSQDSITAAGLDVRDSFPWTPENTSAVFNKFCELKTIPLFASALAGGRLSIKTISKGEGVSITLVEGESSANGLAFGNEPFFAIGSTEYPVKDHVPTPEYDATHKKALVESRVWETVRNKDISRPSLYVESFDTNIGVNYSISLVENLRPNGVTIQYFDKNNNVVTLRDYLGDGRILYRDKASTGPGEPVVFSYPPDAVQPAIDPSDGVSSFGNIDYDTGDITNLVFPTFTTSTGALYPTFKPALVVGRNVSWPIYMQRDSQLYLDVNGVTKEFLIPKNVLTDLLGNALPADKQTYKAQDMADLLNGQEDFRLSGLVAGVSGGQLYIQNTGIDPDTNLRINIGPTYTLTLARNDAQFISDAGNIKSCNKLLFGLNPLQYAPTKVYVSYSYTVNDPSAHRHVWYQTPHFLLRSAGGPSQFITKGHLSYLLDKLALFRPAVSSLDNIEFASSFTEQTAIADSLDVSHAENVTLPYIRIASRPQVPTTYSGNVERVLVINPDDQEGSITPGYTYL